MILPAMTDARDAEDRRLLEAGEYRQLLDGYYGVIIERCILKTKSRTTGLEVASNVVERILSELKRGKTYDVPFRVVVHKVIEWKVSEQRAGVREAETELGDADVPVEDFLPEAVEKEAFESLLDGLTDLERQVIMLRYWYGRTPAEIATELGKTRNAVDQRLHTAHAKIRERLDGP